jgi:hypothetical protein
MALLTSAPLLPNRLESELKSVKAERDRLASQLDAVRRAIDPAPGSSTQSSEPVAHGVSSNVDHERPS